MDRYRPTTLIYRGPFPFIGIIGINGTQNQASVPPCLLLRGRT